MIKAKKSLLITLFAAVMMFAFGATSAFAATPDWSFTDDLSQIVSSDGLVKYDTAKSWDATHGQVVVKADTAKYGDIKAGAAALEKRYYDLTDSVFSTNGTSDLAQIYDAGFTAAKVTHLKVVAPSGVKVATGDNNYAYVKPADIKAATGNVWEGTIKLNEDYVENSTEDQTVKISLAQKWTGSVAEDKIPVQGAPKEAQITVTGKTIPPTGALFFMDEVDKTATASKTEVPYDGAEHTVVMNDVKGYTVKYTVFDSTTGKWNAVDAVKVTNVGETQAKATLYNAKNEKAAEFDLTVKVTALTNAFEYGFKATTEKGPHSFDAVNYVQGTEYDAYSFITAAATDKKYKAAVAAGQADFAALFKEVYDITATVSKDDENEVALTVEAKDLKDAEKEALIKKYEALTTNFGITKTNISALMTAGYTTDICATATVYLNQETGIAPEIEFVDSPTAVTYKAKKLKKKAASFTVTAVCSDGQAVTYKLIDAPAKIKIDKATGMITLNKGLKKGTYKIKVKAYLKSQPQFVYETQAIKIKVKK